MLARSHTHRAHNFLLHAHFAFRARTFFAPALSLADNTSCNADRKKWKNRRISRIYLERKKKTARLRSHARGFVMWKKEENVIVSSTGMKLWIEYNVCLYKLCVLYTHRGVVSIDASFSLTLTLSISLPLYLLVLGTFNTVRGVAFTSKWTRIGVGGLFFFFYAPDV